MVALLCSDTTFPFSVTLHFLKVLFSDFLGNDYLLESPQLNTFYENYTNKKEV